MGVFFFIDESGHPHPNDPTTRPVLGAVGLPIQSSRDLARQIHNLKRDILKDVAPEHEEKYKSASIFNQRTFRRQRHKWEYLESVFELAVNFPVMSVFIVMERPDRPVAWPEAHLPMHIRRLLHRLQGHMANERSGGKGILVFDSQSHKADRRQSVAIASFMFQHYEGRLWQDLVETPMFVESSITPGIQIADYFVSCVRQYHQMKDDPHSTSPEYGRALKRLHGAVQRTVYDYDDNEGNKWWGEYFMPSRWFDQQDSATDRNEAQYMPQ